MTKKTAGWENRLVSYLSGVARKRFEYGDVDCALFAAGAVQVMTGDDHTLNSAGKYRSLKEGLLLMKQHGFKNHVEYAASLFEECEGVLMAQRGDVAVVPAEGGGFALGIVQGANVYIMTNEGLGSRSLTDAIRAFRI